MMKRGKISRCGILALILIILATSVSYVDAAELEGIGGNTQTPSYEDESASQDDGNIENQESTVKEDDNNADNKAQPDKVDNNNIDNKEDGLRENSWRYKDGVPIQTEDNTDSGLRSAARAYHPNATRTGIDVSEHNGVIDWEKVKNAGIDYAIIRCGYGMDMPSQDDKYWLRNVSECERLGIPYGVYIYSYATDVSRAKSEAEHVLRLISGRSLSYPVYFDMEEDNTINSDLPAIARTFCDTISAAGYPVGVYANLNWWNNYLTDSCFSNWYRWVAQYNSSCDYNGNYSMWQYSSKGKVDGITANNGNVDMNYLIGYPADHGRQFVGPFVDVRFTDWYGNAIFFVYNAKIMTGMTPNKFGPTENLNRGQFVTTLWRMAGSPSMDYTNEYSDVPDGQFYTDAVLWASKNHLVNGYENGKFGPADNINREQMASIMYAYAAYQNCDVAVEKDMSGFPDAGNISGFAQNAMKWAADRKLIRGKAGNKLDPQGVTNRAECAIILNRFMEPFEDVRYSDWYGSAVSFNYYSGYMTGLNSNIFGPGGNLARAQFATTLYRMEKEPAVTYDKKFSDVPENQFYTNPVLWASADGVNIVNGYENGMFGPGDNITREQIATMLYRYAKYKAYDVSDYGNLDNYADVSFISPFAKDAMHWAVGAGIISGKSSSSLAPQSTSSRAECAIMIMRFKNKYSS